LRDDDLRAPALRDVDDLRAADERDGDLREDAADFRVEVLRDDEALRPDDEALRDDDERELEERRAGTFFPSARASDRPIAIACLRLFTVLPLRPLFSVPALRSCIARSTFLLAALEYLRAM
jgi:hypothetical protein